MAALQTCIELDIKPRDIMTMKAFENAVSACPCLPPEEWSVHAARAQWRHCVSTVCMPLPACRCLHISGAPRHGYGRLDQRHHPPDRDGAPDHSLPTPYPPLTRPVSPRAAPCRPVPPLSTPRGPLTAPSQARSAGVDFRLEDFRRISAETPFISDLKPSGKCVVE